MHDKAVRDKTVLLRTNGMAIKQIAKTMSLPVSTVFYWIKDIHISEEMQKEIMKNKRTGYHLPKMKWKKQTSDKKSNYNPKLVGEKTESKILARFVDADMTVLFPFGDNQRYDLVVDENGKFIRVQCKTARFRGRQFVFKSSSSNWNSGAIHNYIGQADVFAIYLRENDKVYIFKVKNCPKTECSAWLLDKQYGNSARRYASDHEFVPGKSLKRYK